MTAALLDVVIPAREAAATLPSTLASLAEADAGLVRSITVVDGGSRDTTAEVARGAGAGVARTVANRGAQLALGATCGQADWLLFLHADTVLSAGWPAVVRGFVDAPANHDKVGYFRLRFASPDRRARRVERLAAWRCRRLGLPYGDQGLLVARRTYDTLGGFRPLPLMEDVDLVRRLGRRRLVPLAAEAITSAVRYERDGWLLRPLRNLSCLALYGLGVAPATLRRLYG